MSLDLNELAMELTDVDMRARNAVKHGMAARRVTVAHEDAAAFETLRDELIKHWRPRNVTAYMLVDHLARCQWRLMRAVESELRVVEMAQEYKTMWDGEVARTEPLPVGHALANDIGRDQSRLVRMQLFQGRLERSVQRTISLLLTMRKPRVKQGNSQGAKET